MASMEGTSSSTLPPKLSIGILSIGEMGLGVAKLLRAHDFPVVTVASGRRHVGSLLTDWAAFADIAGKARRQLRG